MGVKTWVIVVCAALGGLLGYAGAVLELPDWAPFVPIAAAFAAQQVYCRYLAAGRVRRRLARMADPDAGPPAGAEPIEAPVLDRLHAAQAWADIAPLLTDDFVLIDHRGRRRGKDFYRRSSRAWSRIYPEADSAVETMVADPAAAHVVYVRATYHGRPRFGPRLASTSWTRYELTPERGHVRAVASAGIVRVE